MPRFTCESCRTSLYSAARPANLTDPSCPICGASFEQPEPITAAVPAITTLELQR